ncbi:unnamed protein product [Thelazia callipaeda]|uniref:PCRF domain-containing protein n=1 Tax=Thelazia callipaeda TaxID=103827 RepID=A0A0N5CZC9_THECL|nr:unnamed protein product [Thelazia callipaeda]
MGDEKLITSIRSQLNRLMLQLAEIELEKESLDEQEYLEIKNDSLEQLKELEQSLNRMECGDVSLIDKLTATKMSSRLAFYLQEIRNAISEAFKIPEIIAMFGEKDHDLLDHEKPHEDACEVYQTHLKLVSVCLTHGETSFIFSSPVM